MQLDPERRYEVLQQFGVAIQTLERYLAAALHIVYRDLQPNRAYRRVVGQVALAGPRAPHSPFGGVLLLERGQALEEHLAERERLFVDGGCDGLLHFDHLELGLVRDEAEDVENVMRGQAQRHVYLEDGQAALDRPSVDSVSVAAAGSVRPAIPPIICGLEIIQA